MYSDHLLEILIYLVMHGSRHFQEAITSKHPDGNGEEFWDCQIHWVFPYQDLKIRLFPTGFDLGILKFETCSFFFQDFPLVELNDSAGPTATQGGGPSSQHAKQETGVTAKGNR